MPAGSPRPPKFRTTAQQLPQLVNDQRQAAIQQILDGLTVQGANARCWTHADA